MNGLTRPVPQHVRWLLIWRTAGTSLFVLQVHLQERCRFSSALFVFHFVFHLLFLLQESKETVFL